ncbi:hypothetical protein ACU045_06885 [Microbacterium sp. MAHUQ-60]|uniref:hypothetical protein n=1 Tax=unclassified Microbacterium TaxID=2609290 RepID=UPI003671288A
MADETDARGSDGVGQDPALWGDAGAFDPFATDLFTQEIANIAESDWDLDADEIWGDLDGTPDVVDDADGSAFFG